jgi:hypothetical protein
MPATKRSATLPRSSFVTCMRVEPRAMRMPISRVRPPTFSESLES